MRAKRKYKLYQSDPDAQYAKVYEYDFSRIEPQVACPNLPSNVKPVSQLGDVAIDQVVIGSCTNGRITDLRLAAKVLKGRKVHPKVRLIVIPATPEVYKQALEDGLLKIFTEADAAVSTPPAAPAWEGIWGFWLRGSGPWPPRTATSPGAWGTPRARFICATRLWPQPRPFQGILPGRRGCRKALGLGLWALGFGKRFLLPNVLFFLCVLCWAPP